MLSLQWMRMISACTGGTRGKRSRRCVRPANDRSDHSSLLWQICWAHRSWSGGRLSFGDHGTDQRLEDLDTVGAAQLRLAGALRVRHHAQHVASGTADAGNVVERAVGIGFCRNLALRGRIAEE